MSDAPTFRDFASQIFAGDIDSAAKTLTTLLDLTPERARSASEHFRAQAADPTFLPKAMSLRTAVQGTDDGAIAALLVDCFGISSDEAKVSTAALRSRYAM